MHPALERIEKNAEALQKQYKSANALLKDAVSEAIPWASALGMRGVVPDVPKLERLATQLLAIIMASEPE